MCLPAAELNEPNVLLTSKNVLRILNTIKPVMRVFTAMVAAKAVRFKVHPSGKLIIIGVKEPVIISYGPAEDSQEAPQVAR